VVEDAELGDRRAQNLHGPSSISRRCGTDGN
jgi:hypothetical protein